jgi:phosphotransferase system IIB component
MLRLFTCAAMALLIGAGVGLADEKKAPKKPAKKPAGVVGVVVSYQSGTLKVTVRVKKEKQEKEYKLSDETPVIIGRGKKAEKLTASSAKEKLAKKGTRVRIILKEDGSVKNVRVLPARKPKKKPKADK